MEYRSAQAGREVHDELSGYFARLRAAHAQAAGRGPFVQFLRSLAGSRLRIACAGEALSAAMTRALEHLPPVDGVTPPGLEILAWDEGATGVGLPAPPWSWPRSAADLQFVLPRGGEAFRIHYAEDEAVFSMYCVETAQAVVVCRDAAMLPSYFHASPCANVVHWWRESRGLQLLHAGCVGENGAAALLVGPSGSGKSTTSLLCASAGMDYVSDDLCLLVPEPAPEAVCLYNSGKLHRDHLRNLPVYAALAEDPGRDRDDKSVVFMHRHFPQRIAPRLPIKAILASRVTGQARTSATPISAPDALRALAPSTLFMKPPYDPDALSALARLVRACPCYRLDLGTETADIPAVVRSILGGAN